MQPPLLRDLRAQGGGLGVVDGALEPARQPRALLVVGGGDAVHLGHELLRHTLHLLLFPLLERGARAGAAVAAALERREPSEQRLAQRSAPGARGNGGGEVEVAIVEEAVVVVVAVAARATWSCAPPGTPICSSMRETSFVAARNIASISASSAESAPRPSSRAEAPRRASFFSAVSFASSSVTAAVSCDFVAADEAAASAPAAAREALLGGLLERGLECGVFGLEGRDGLGRRRAVGPQRRLRKGRGEGMRAGARSGGWGRRRGCWGRRGGGAGGAPAARRVPPTRRRAARSAPPPSAPPRPSPPSTERRRPPSPRRRRRPRRGGELAFEPRHLA